MKNTWRSIWIMTLASLAVWIAAYVIVRIVPPAIAQAVEPPDDEEGPIGPPVKEQEELPPDLRQSADNNVSFPVDI
ncbi:MAG TPA: hypothetical protein PK681_02820 [Steroidobacteraceae bacterium]|nr:hypothetical protein [Steroidobacteraceae bacterium]HQW09784.1 hypothetical protein [Steroidobacteraceae bacterium]HQX47361.1 hypothetical protein [Steroidobacteraceae bacterium]HQX77259.1 hypothetical protein [Steroidobacteraceae bacterium]HQZ79529.1 hypothetical protein [Steroidobacteraceae bacterium]